MGVKPEQKSRIFLTKEDVPENVQRQIVKACNDNPDIEFTKLDSRFRCAPGICNQIYMASIIG